MENDFHHQIAHGIDTRPGFPNEFRIHGGRYYNVQNRAEKRGDIYRFNGQNIDETEFIRLVSESEKKYYKGELLSTAV
jgi:hypothetical protein